MGCGDFFTSLYYLSILKEVRGYSLVAQSHKM